MDDPEPAKARTLDGIAGSPGLAVGRAVVVSTKRAGVRRSNAAGAHSAKRRRIAASIGTWRISLLRLAIVILRS